MTGSEGGPVMDASLERQIHVAAHEAGERLDRLASAHCDALSRTRIQQLIEVGAIRLNDRPTRAGATVRAGDVIIFNEALIHNGRPNPSDRLRITLIVNFGRADAGPWPGYEPAPATLAAVSGRQRRILTPGAPVWREPLLA